MMGRKGAMMMLLFEDDENQEREGIMKAEFFLEKNPFRIENINTGWDEDERRRKIRVIIMSCSDF